MSPDGNLVWQDHKVGKINRQKIKNQKACVIWFTGLSGSGKSTIANELEYTLNKMGLHTYLLDGDNIRHGLNNGLGFSKEDRDENIRRIGEVSKLFVDAGLITIAAFISPFAKAREGLRMMFEEDEYFEIYVKCPISLCKTRDPKRLYEKALSGEINEFTGIDQSYEESINPDIVLETDSISVSDCVTMILNYLKGKKIICLDRHDCQFAGS